MATTRKTFESAQHRARLSPVEYEIDGVVFVKKAWIDMMALAPVIESMQAPAPEGMSEIASAAHRITLIVGVLGEFWTDETRGQWDEVGRKLDAATLMDLSSDLIAEVTGRLPTLPSSSDDGSSTTGSPSTAGAPAEALTPLPSPPIVPATPTST